MTEPASTPSQRTGRCLCGAITWAYEPPEKWRVHCHCKSCRRATSSPMTTWIGVPRSRFRWTGEEPAVYRSSPGVRRSFCSRCGSPMAYQSDGWPGEIHLYACALEDPENVSPQAHVYHAERLPWFETADDLERLPGPGAG